MGQNLGRYRANVQRVLGHPNEQVITGEEIDNQINHSYIDVAGMLAHNRLKADDTISTVDGDKEYGKPSDYWYMRIVKDETNNQKLTYRRLEWIEEREDGTTGQPLYWTIEDDHIRFYPTPDDAYTIRLWYVKRPVELALPTDTDALEREFSEPIELGAQARCFYIMGEYDRQVHALNLQRVLLDRVPVDDDQDASTGESIIGMIREKARTTL